VSKTNSTPSTDSAATLPLIGGQLSTAGGWSQVPGRAEATAAEVVQVFSSNPRIWPVTPPDVVGLTALSVALSAEHIPVFIHAVYLINPASPDPDLRARSTAALAHALLTGALARAAGVVTHLGSHRGEGFERAAPWVAETITQARCEAELSLAELSADVSAGADLGADAHTKLPRLLLETSAGSGATVGATLEELQTLLGLLGAAGAAAPAAAAAARPGGADSHFGLCLDTAHMFAAGYALHTETGLAALVDGLQRCALLGHVGLVHLNDSASLFDSKRDRHANPGEGELGYEGLARIVRHPAFAQAPFALEVPGSEGHGPGLAEITLVKRMRQGAPAPQARTADGESGPTAPE
jgi:deoxyribonuclease-4